MQSNRSIICATIYRDVYTFPNLVLDSFLETVFEIYLSLCKAKKTFRDPCHSSGPETAQQLGRGKNYPLEAPGIIHWHKREDAAGHKRIHGQITTESVARYEWHESRNVF